MRAIDTQGRSLHASVHLHPLLKRVKQCWVGNIVGDVGRCDDLLRLKKLEKALGTKPADGVLPAGTVELVLLCEVTAEAPQRGGRHRLQRAPRALRPRDELRRTCQTTADALVAIPALREPVGEEIQIRAGGSCVVGGLGRLTGGKGREHTALPPYLG